MSTEITVLSRPGCHLCDVMKSQLDELLPQYGTQARLVDVTGDPELLAEYGDRVPVLMLDGEVFAEYRVDLPALRTALEQAGAR